MRFAIILLSATALIGLAGSTSAAEIVRMKAPPGPTPSLILQGVKIPGRSEMVILSGQLASPADPAKPAASLTMADYGDSKTQTISVLNKIKGLLAGQGYAMSDIVKMTLFVAADPKLGKMDFAGVNEGFKMFFGTAENPETVARSAVQVAALAGPNYLIEIEAIAVKAPR